VFSCSSGEAFALCSLEFARDQVSRDDGSSLERTQSLWLEHVSVTAWQADQSKVKQNEAGGSAMCVASICKTRRPTLVEGHGCLEPIISWYGTWKLSMDAEAGMNAAH
jgi:hypothetical protein